MDRPPSISPLVGLLVAATVDLADAAAEGTSPIPGGLADLSTTDVVTSLYAVVAVILGAFVGSIFLLRRRHRRSRKPTKRKVLPTDFPGGYS